MCEVIRAVSNDDEGIDDGTAPDKYQHAQWVAITYITHKLCCQVHLSINVQIIEQLVFLKHKIWG